MSSFHSYFVGLKLSALNSYTSISSNGSATLSAIKKEISYSFKHSWLHLIFLLNQLSYMRSNFSVAVIYELRWELKRAFDRYRYFFKKHVYTINHKRIALNYFYFSM